MFMTDALFSALEVPDANAPGYRLHHLEVLNWGTFHEKIWRFVPGCETSLLTGDIGSGKSTIVDGITTLFMPAQKIAYNKAAGAEVRERTLRSYVEGHYRSERGDDAHRSRTRGLREGRSSYSVLLAVFINSGYDERVTIAQVFQQRESTGQPYRFFVTHSGELSIAEDFSDFGSDLRDLRKRLRGKGVSIFDEFPKYGASMRRLLGIPSEQAMELFHQTVSMKSVGNLNEFVREHMLEPSPADERVQAIIGHFDDLTQAYDAVVRAREQLDALEPIARSAKSYDDTLATRVALEVERDSVGPFILELRLGLLAQEITDGETRVGQLERQAGELDARLTSLDDERTELITQRAQAGGDRLAELERLEREARVEADRRAERRKSFDDAVAATESSPVANADDFLQLTAAAAARAAELDSTKRALSHETAEKIADARDAAKRAATIEAELDNLRTRESNLPAEQVQLRAWLCQELGLTPADVPFAGELMDVAPEHTEWRGAAERVLRGFALSMLVPVKHYAAVSQWVNTHKLGFVDGEGRRRGGRLVYEKVTDRIVPLRDETHGTLAEVVTLRPGPFEEYLRNELLRRANHHRALTLDEFRSAEHQRAVTREGQVRSGARHEKDDRHPVDDPRRFVLGWVNEAKVAALSADLDAARAAAVDDDAAANALLARQDALEQQARAWRVLAQFTHWEELDHDEATRRANQYREDHRRLRESSDQLAELQAAIDRIETQLKDSRAENQHVTGELAMARDIVAKATAQQRQDEEQLSVFDEAQLAAARAAYPSLESRVGQRRATSSAACEGLAGRLANELNAAIQARSKELSGHAAQLISAMHSMLGRWPELHSDMDPSVEARGDFLVLQRNLAEDDLPRFEGEFKELLNQHTIQELAGFNNWLQRQASAITDRIGKINEALGAVPYGEGTYLRLDKEPTTHQEVVQFRADLRNLTDDALAQEDDTYSEQRFRDVRRIIERFRGREGHADADRAWTRRVTDVRNWFVFSASERYTDDDREREHYSDSDGKSGGQKEKLAYTILAASLAYQFGLEWGADKSKAFQFAVIDEAFGRGSDASTRYALELFAKLGLQLLIVTPLQKVHIIESYVQAIGFVDNVDGANSRIQTLTIDEYRSRKAKR
ncbi:ATP-binding protein [uncultured Tessaracoccus sp.]|uniref:ATP-binding protein n=1 Tax=uncultured Tessaracoccus sp. TaxID=905023 RepID=UPI00260CC885|nr:SbcC/MukB-like Walker B domain-containing protein [uncultured Tessaracoccus sp.]